MSMLTRKGTMVKKKRGSGRQKSSVRRTQSGTSSTSGSIRKAPIEDETDIKTPRIRIESGSAKPSPARSVTSTVVSFEDEKRPCSTKIDWNRKRISASQPGQYSAFLLQFKEASKEADDTCDFVCRSLGILCNTLLITVLVGIMMILPVTMISVGVKYLEECPVEPKLPVYLLVGGCFGLLKLLALVWKNIQTRRFEDVDVFYDSNDSDSAFASSTYKMMELMLTLFLLGWLITGTYWTYQIYTPNYQQLLHQPSNWCERTVYLFALYQILGSYGLIVFMLLLTGCFAAYYKLVECLKVTPGVV